MADIITLLLAVLVGLPGAALSSDYLVVKIPHIPPSAGDIRWGMPEEELNKTLPSATCENDNGEVTCDYVGEDRVVINFFLNSNGLSYISTMTPLPTSNPSKIEEELALLEKNSEIKLRRQEHDGKVTFLTEGSAWSCKSRVWTGDSGFQGFSTACEPKLFIQTLIQKPVKDEFKILDLILGKATKADILSLAKANQWSTLVLGPKDKESIIAHDLKLAGITTAEFNLLDNLLMSVSYKVDPGYKDKASFYKLLISKYGQPSRDEKKYFVWETNNDTRNRVTIGMSFDGKPENVQSLWYTLTWLSEMDIERKLFQMQKELVKAEELKSKAF